MELDNSGESAPLLFTNSIDDRKSTSKNQGHRKGTKKSRPRDSAYRVKIFKSICVCLNMISSGFVASLLGPIFLDLQLITHTNIQQASALITAASAGQLFASMMSAIIYNHISQDLLLIADTMLMMVVTLVIPFCSPYWLMIVDCFLLYGSHQIIIIVVDSEMLTLWGAEAIRILQAAHLAFAAGALIAPLLVKPFLAHRNFTAMDHFNHSTREHNQTYALDAYIITNTTISPPGPPEPETRIHFACLIVSTLSFLFAAPLLVDYIRNCYRRAKAKSHRLELSDQENIENSSIVCTKVKEAPPDSQGNVPPRKRGKTNGVSKPRMSIVAPSAPNLPLMPYIAVVIGACLMFMFAIGSQLTTNNWLASYVVLELQWSKPQGALLTSVCWISTASPRILWMSLDNNTWFSSVKVLAISFTVVILSLVSLILASHFQLDWCVWLSVVSYGVALSPVYACTIEWINDELVPVTGKVVSCMSASLQVGLMISSAMLGDLVENQGAMWIAYVVLGETILTCLTFISLLLISRLFIQSTYGSLAKREVTTCDQLQKQNGRWNADC